MICLTLQLITIRNIWKSFIFLTVASTHTSRSLHILRVLLFILLVKRINSGSASTASGWGISKSLQIPCSNIQTWTLRFKILTVLTRIRLSLNTMFLSTLVKCEIYIKSFRIKEFKQNYFPSISLPNECDQKRHFHLSKTAHDWITQYSLESRCQWSHYICSSWNRTYFLSIHWQMETIKDEFIE